MQRQSTKEMRSSRARYLCSANLSSALLSGPGESALPHMVLNGRLYCDPFTLRASRKLFLVAVFPVDQGMEVQASLFSSEIIMEHQRHCDSGNRSRTGNTRIIIVLLLLLLLLEIRRYRFLSSVARDPKLMPRIQS